MSSTSRMSQAALQLSPPLALSRSPPSNPQSSGRRGVPCAATIITIILSPSQSPCVCQDYAEIRMISLKTHSKSQSRTFCYSHSTDELSSAREARDFPKVTQLWGGILELDSNPSLTQNLGCFQQLGQ